MILVLMGVSGSGKTTVGRKLAHRLGWPFYDADDFHPPQNVAKMSRHEPLTDDDRKPWLQAIRRTIASHSQAGSDAVVTCSALRQRYRDVLTDHDRDANVKLVLLHGEYEMLYERMVRRTDHFMPAALLRSQFDTLEPLRENENAVVVDASGRIEQIVERIVKYWRLGNG